MSKTTLRAYNREIEQLIEQGHRLDEAVAHCLHILRTYPKHLETYRLLGKAYLEAKRYDQAVDIFQRVLVAAPEDFVAHVGMSIIADDQAKLDEAIWHMERAFEVQPSNAAIQAELQRLFGRRDGVEPPKIRLTRGALAHMYVQGELYAQAISEIRAVLAQDPNRTDMQVLLARAYSRNSQKAEAADVCSALLGISPYCLDANKLMAESDGAAPETDAIREYRRRVIELDPYAEFAQGSMFNAESAPEGSVTLQRLDYNGRGAAGSVDMGLSLDAAIADSEPTESAPSWMPAPPKPGLATDERSQPLDTPAVPDFLADAGWQPVPTSAGTESMETLADAENESGLKLGDLPEWVRALDPGDDADRQARSEAETVNTRAWLQESNEADLGIAEATSPQAVAPSEDDTPGWLKDLSIDTEEQSEESLDATPPPGSTRLAQPPAPASPGSSVQTPDDGLAWLEGLAEKHGAKPNELLTPRDSRPSEPPAWAEDLRQGAALTPAPAESARMPVESSDSFAASETESENTAAEGRPFDWMSRLSDQKTFQGMEAASESEQAPIMEDLEAPDWHAPDRSQPPPIPTRWDSGGDGRAVASQARIENAEVGDSESEGDLPDWLAGLDRAQHHPAAAPQTMPPPKPPAKTEDLPEWLRVPDAPAPVTPPPEPREWRPLENKGVPEARAEVREELRERMETPEETRDADLSAPAAEPPISYREPIPNRARALSDPSSDTLPSLNVAKAELGRGNIAAALQQYERLIRRGRSLEEIIRDLRDALYRYPVEVAIWQALGDAYMRANRLQEALDAYTKAEELLR